MPEWDSEIEVDAELARTLIAQRYPTLDARVLHRVGEGWDNTVWATADGIAFRFPRREIAVAGVRREIELLPGLAAALPAPIPDAAYPGAPASGYPWPWFGSRLIPGAEIAFTDLPVARRVGLAGELGRFLGCLHGLDPSLAPSLALDPLGRADMTTRIPRTRAALDQVAGLWDGDGDARRLLERAGASSADGDPVIVHGDLNLRHALVTSSGALAGVIDWGDACRAPRSVDCALYWSLFDGPGRAAFRDAYGPLSDATLARARVLSLFFDATLAVYAHDRGMAALERAALGGLRRTITD